jgi:hypothetical protein
MTETQMGETITIPMTGQAGDEPVRVTPGIQDFGGGQRADVIGVSQKGGDDYAIICVTADAARALAAALIEAADWCDKQF